MRRRVLHAKDQAVQQLRTYGTIPTVPPRKPGRPMEGDKPRNKRIFVLATEDDISAIDAWADAHGTSRSSAVIRMVRERLRRDGY
tara:strand:- start:1803 stop:2057 length:255 start_codon:yes stop_codon:yes gene_type:complete